MRGRFVRAAALSLAAGLLVTPLARAAERVSGTVLAREPNGDVLMHHDATGTMPAMTMEFAVPPGTTLVSGDRIEATADTTREPWRLSHVRIGGHLSAPAAAHAMVAPLRAGDRVPDEAFRDDRGGSFSLRDLYGHPYALTFVYTRCRDARMCPLVSGKLASVQRLTPQPVRLVEVTLDPDHDTPAVLATYGRLFGDDPARFRLLVASPVATARFASRFGILARRTDATTIVHSERLAIVDGHGRIRELVDDALWAPADVARRLTSLR